MASNAVLGPNIDIHGEGFDLTPPLRERINNKIGKVVEKLSVGLVRSTHVNLRVHNYPLTENHKQLQKKGSQIAEATVRMKGGVTINAQVRTDDMYASIDLVSHKLAQSLKKHNEKVKNHYVAEGKESISSILFYDGKAPSSIPSDDSFDEEELLVDLDAKYKDFAVDNTPKVDMSVVREKSFPMPPISVEDAILCLQFVDHPFYVFRNKDTNEINVVYKRNGGGVGVIKSQ